MIFSQTARGVTTIKELKKNFQRFNLQLAVTWRIGANVEHNYHDLSKSLDYLHIIEPIDYYNSTEEQAIKSLHISSMENRINTAISMGIPTSKVVMDLYFSVFQFQKFGSVPVVIEWPYNRFCDITNETSIWDRHYHSGASLIMLQSKNESSAVFQNTRSMANRARLAMKSNLAGVAPVFINFDDFHGRCGIDDDTFDDFKPTTKFTKEILKRNFPLLRTINEAIIAALDEIQQEPKPSNSFTNIFCKFLHFC